MPLMPANFLRRLPRLLSPWLQELIAVAGLVVLTTWLDGGPGLHPRNLFGETPWLAIWKVLTNALPGLMLALLLLALARRVWFSFLIAGGLTLVVYAVNAVKLANLATPLMPEDFLMLGQVGRGGLELLGKYLPSSALVSIMALAGIAVLGLLWRFEPRRATPARLPRWGVAIVLAAGWIGLILAAPFWGAIYDAGALQLQPWSAKRTVEDSGLVNSLVLFHLHYSSALPEPEPAQARKLIAAHRTALAERLAQPTTPPFPDIVVVQSESFFDPAILSGYVDGQFTPALKQLQRQGMHGELGVPTFGGATIRTEFEVLTGLNLRYFKDVQFPYLELHAGHIPSVLDVLEQHGYTTMAVHPNRAEFWNRSAAFRQFGFDAFIALDDFPADALGSNRYTPDSALTDEILARLEDDGPPQFLFAISMEGHGPYGADPDVSNSERAAIPLPPGVSGEPAVALRNFLHHLRHADAELGRLATALGRRERPSLLLFYGDHLPALVPAFEAAGFDNGKSFFRQTVPWLLIRPGHPAPAVTLRLAADMLPGILLDAAGIHDQPYFALTLLVGEELAGLAQAPDAPPLQPTATQARLDRAMADVTWLRFQGKLEPLFDSVLGNEPEQNRKK